MATKHEVEAIFKLKDEMSVQLQNIQKRAAALEKEAKGLISTTGQTQTVFGELTKGLDKFAPGMGRAVSSVTEMTKGLSPLSIGLGVAGAAVGAVALGIRGLVKEGDRLANLSRQFRLGTEEIQRMEAGGRGLGITIDSLARESAFLEKTLGAGGKGAIQALRELGLSGEKLARMRADERLIAVHGALVKIQNPLKQSALGAELLGKGFEKMTEADFRSFQDDAESALTLTDRATTAGDELGDSWDTLLANSKVLALEGLAPLAEALASVVKRMNDLATARAPQFAVNAFFTGPAGALVAADKAKTRALVHGRNQDIMRELAERRTTPTGLTDDEEDRLRRERQRKAEKEWADAIARARNYWTNLKAMSEEFRESISLVPGDPADFEKLFLQVQALGAGGGELGDVPVGGRFAGQFLGGFKETSVDFTNSIAQSTGAVADLNESLQNLASLSQVIGPRLASMFSGLSSGIAGFREIKSIFKEGFGGGGFLGILGDLGGIASGIGAIAGPIIAGLKGLFSLGGPDIGRDIGRDIGVGISKELEKAIKESGKNAQFFLTEIFAEGELSVDRFAEEIGDLFSMFQRGDLTEGSLISELEEDIPLLLQHLNELGPSGEAQLQRIIGAAQSMGIEFQGLSELIQGTFAPDTMESIAQSFELSNDEVRELGELLGVNIQTDLERMAATLGLSVDEFNALGAAVSERFGIPVDQLDELLGSLGVSADELAASLGVEVQTGADELTAAAAASNVELGIGVDLAGQLALNLERAAAASGGIRIPTLDSFAAAEGIDRVFTRPTLGLFGEAGPEHVRITPLGGGGGGGVGGVTMSFNINVSGGADQAQIDNLIRQLRNNMRGAADELAATLKDRM